MENVSRDASTKDTSSREPNTKQMKVVWMITENGDKSYWTRIGAAFTNRDGSLAVQLDALPGPRARVQIRDYTPRDADAQDGPEGEGRAVAGGRDAHREARDGARRRDARASELSP